MEGKYLITTDNWFIAPDGKSYRAVWGEAKTMTAAEALGLEPNRNSANWMVRVGTDEHHIILAGCQIHYAVRCPERPNQEDTLQKFSDDKEKTLRDNCIYIPEPPARIDVENIDGKEVEWLTDKDKLIQLLQSNVHLLRSPYIDGHSILSRANAGAFKRFRSYREAYAKNPIVEIEFVNGESVVLRD